MTLFRCSPDWHSRKASTSYLNFILTFGFFAPMSTIVLSSIVTCVKIRKVRRTVCGETRRRSLKRNRIALTLVLLMNVFFLACWIPYGVVTMIVMFKDGSKMANWYVFISYTTSFLFSEIGMIGCQSVNQSRRPSFFCQTHKVY